MVISDTWSVRVFHSYVPRRGGSAAFRFGSIGAGMAAAGGPRDSELKNTPFMHYTVDMCFVKSAVHEKLV